MKKKLLLPIMLSSAIITVQNGYSQLNYLPLGASNNSGIYTDLGTNGTVIATANYDNANSAPQNIGFTFNYNGTAFTQFVLNTNGFIKLGNSNPSIDSLFFQGTGTTLGVFNSANPADANIISIFNNDLQAGTAPTEYRVSTNGSPGSRICTIQFKNVRDKTLSSSDSLQYDNMQFQIKLYETSNTIEFIYGAWTPSINKSALKRAAVGLKGLNNTSAQLLVVSKTSGQSWNAAAFDPLGYTGSTSLGFGNPPNKPAPDAGRTFRFIQAHPNDATVNLFTLGSIPVPYGAPRVDSAVVKNIGMNTLTNINVTLNITGANTFTDTKTITTLASGASATVGFAPYTPSNLGTNNVSVSIPNDDDNTNNTDIYTQIVNNTIFSYADAKKAAGGISGQNFPGYLAAKYTITGTTIVTGANIYIANDAASIGKSVYAILFDNGGNKVDSSASYTITVSDTGKYYSFIFPVTPAITNSSFYVGLAQSAIGFNALGYQKEVGPVRLDAYFIRSMNSTTFSDLGGINSLTPYRLMIQAVVSNTTGILKNTNENTVVAYPNPFTDKTHFNIKSDNVKDVSFYLYDVTGRIVKTMKNVNTSEFTIERENLQSGIYFYKLNNNDKIIGSGKLIIE